MRRVFQHNLCPSLKDGLGDVKLPVDLSQEYPFVDGNLGNPKARHLAPGFCRVVAVLQILRSQDQGSEKHPPAAHKCTVGRAVFALFLGEVILRHVRLDQHEIVQGYLQRRVACTRSTKCLLNVGTKREHSTSVRSLASARHH